MSPGAYIDFFYVSLSLSLSFLLNVCDFLSSSWPVSIDPETEIKFFDAYPKFYKSIPWIPKSWRSRRDL